jgi:hypothetical protein
VCSIHALEGLSYVIITANPHWRYLTSDLG